MVNGLKTRHQDCLINIISMIHKVLQTVALKPQAQQYARGVINYIDFKLSQKCTCGVCDDLTVEFDLTIDHL